MDTNPKLVVIALGGNALNSPEGKGDYEEQRANVNKAARNLVSALKAGEYRFVLTHGNGPQVGNILLQQELSKDTLIPMPLAVCGAESQGMIGTFLVQAFSSVMREVGRRISIACVVTHVVVDPEDQAFQNPTKPIGMMYSPAESAELRKKGQTVKEVKPGLFRRVVASPEPLRVVEAQAVRCLLDAGMLPITVGGGGIPVVEMNSAFEYADAVIDKDLASEVLASQLSAQWLVMLTNVPGAALNYGTEMQEWLGSVKLSEARRCLAEGHFSEGSMKPKMIAAVRFLEKGGERAIIADLRDVESALNGTVGTQITA